MVLNLRVTKLAKTFGDATPPKLLASFVTLRFNSDKPPATIHSMSLTKKIGNLFYVLLILVGVIFTITACAYGVMAVQGIQPPTAQTPQHPLMTFMREYGDMLLLVELAVLAIVTVVAMATDRYFEE